MKAVFWISLFLMLWSGRSLAFTGATESVRGDQIQVQILSSERSLRPGATQNFALRFQPDPHWHVYWKNPGDSGLPPEVQWQKPEDWTAGALIWPLPERIPVGPFYNFGYEGEVIMPFPVTIPRNLSGDTVRLEVFVKWLVCEVECIPGEHLFSWDMPIQKAAKPESSDWQSVIEGATALAPKGQVPARLEVSADVDKIMVTLGTKDIPQGWQLKEFFPEKGSGVKAAPPVINGSTIILEKDAYEATRPFGGLAVFQNAAGERVGYDLNFAGSTAGQEGIWTVILLAFLGGLILNVMPCVLPVLAIKVLSLVRESGADTRKVRQGSLAYGAGVLLSFLALAGLLLLFKAGGEAVGWGFQLQSPAFIAALALLFFLMALNFLDVIQPWNAFTRLGQVGSQQQGKGGQFLSGVLAVLVASPCTGPFMGVAVGSALTRPPVESMLIFIFIGLGFLSPFLALAWIPSSRRLLPKPGLWMETFRQAMAFPLLLTILWLLWVLEKQSGMDGVLWILAAFVGLGFFAWLWLHMKDRAPRAWLWVTPVMLLLCAAAIYGQKRDESTKTASSADTVWQPFSTEKLAKARQQGPVFVDFTAAWCVTCQVNKTLVLNRKDVLEAFAERGIQMMRADWTDYNAEITQVLTSLGRQGVPVYALYRDATSPPILLPEVLTPDLVIKEIGQVTSNATKE
ncbi:protein-disulfide reductase DsbD family protein [Oligoflexus tunisiensis]|uniref:protein-disulfide reductase DsbD family protein n=1 Tax=Oligoflexus tunisiensis TaxID=708132 RepID=UPI000A4E6336|nr:thioredoxin family protein [Oligoflexus tunisiensis]